MTLGEAIKLIRTARGTKQKDIAAKLNVSPNYISLIEKGEREPSISLLKALAAVLDVPVSMFFMWQDLDASAGGRRDLRELGRLLVELQAVVVGRGVRKRGLGRKTA